MGNIKDKFLVKFFGRPKQAVAEINGDGSSPRKASNKPRRARANPRASPWTSSPSRFAPRSRSSPFRTLTLTAPPPEGEDISGDGRRDYDYFRAYAVRTLCRPRSMPQGRLKNLQLVAGRIYNLLKKEAAFGPNTHHLEDFRAAQKLERSLDGQSADGSDTQSRSASAIEQSTGREAR